MVSDPNYNGNLINISTQFYFKLLYIMLHELKTKRKAIMITDNTHEKKEFYNCGYTQECSTYIKVMQF